jgi:nucleotide-binding universal stress UspA family protein
MRGEGVSAQQGGREPVRKTEELTRGLVVRKILVPTDFSLQTGEALEQAVALASPYKAAVTLLHVVDVNAQPDGSDTGVAEEFMTKLWQVAMVRMGQLAAALRGRIELQTMVEDGLPWEQIVERSRDFDLLVLSRTAPGHRWNFFRQNTAKRVVELAMCPVMIIGGRNGELQEDGRKTEKENKIGERRWIGETTEGAC